jgi:Caspase domain
MPGDGSVFGVGGRDRKRLVLLILLLNLLVFAEILPANAQAWLDSEFRNRHERSRFYPEARLKARSTTCGFPWTYSRGLHRCVCLRAGYSVQQGACAPEGASASCGDRERWSPRTASCVCAKGLHRENGACVEGEDETAALGPALAAADPATPVDPRAEATLRAQSCLQQLGFYKGPVDGVVNDDTWTAFWYFKRDHGLKSHRDFVDAPVQEKFASLCKSPEQTATATPAANAGAPSPSEAGLSEHAVPPAKEVTPSFTPVKIDCVPANLLAQLRQSRVGGNALKACTESCLPAPKGLAQADLDALAARHGLHWCNSCVTIEGQLPLADIQRIEKAGNLQLCATPPNQLPQASGLDADGAAYTRIRELYRGLPPAGPPENAIALIIGNRNYESYPHDETAANEAGAVYAFLTEHLGYAPDNVIDVRDTKKLELERLFGAGEGADSTLNRLAHAHPGANFIVYYAGLGATDEAQSEIYLLPVDTERFREERSGYKLSTLYANLQKLGAKSVLVLLEADFGREQGPYLLPPNAPETTRSALPASPLPGVSILAAADRGQRRLIDPTYSVGLFTRYLIEGLSGEADRTPLGNGNGAVDSGEIFAYSAIMTELAARKSFGLMQNPIYSGTIAPVVARSSRD